MTCCRKPGFAFTRCGTLIARLEPALPWFYAIARHVRIDHYRKSVRTTAGERKLEEMSKETETAARKSDHC